MRRSMTRRTIAPLYLRRSLLHIPRPALLLVLATAAVCLATAQQPGTTHALPPFVVNSTGDASDASPGDGNCATAGAVCTLRAAIEEVNFFPPSDPFAQIHFALGGPYPSIALTSPLPTIVDRVSIFGNTGGATRVELNGSGAGPAANGLTISTSNVWVSDLAINRFSGNGIQNSAGGTNQLHGNYVGTDPTGSIDLGNGGAGIANFTGDVVVTANVISGNGGPGILFGDSPFACGGLLLAGDNNIIGLDATGMVDLGNDGAGILVTMEDCGAGFSTNQIHNNVISGNSGDGIIVSVDSDNWVITCNTIGLNAPGTSLIPNGSHGLFIGSDSNETGNDTFVCDLPSTVRPNVIAGHATDQIFLAAGANDNVIHNNYIGTDATGNTGLGGTGTGIVVTGNDNTIGSFNPAEQNVIAGNGGGGIRVGGSAIGTSIRGNKIGVGANGTTLIGNGAGGPGLGAGILLQSSGTRITQNRIAGNLGDGIRNNISTADSNLYDQNFIYSNSGLGINHLGALGADPNDAGDPDSGPNNQQNYPVITSAKSSGVSSAIKATLNTTPSVVHYFEFFSSPACDPSGFGEGQVYLGSWPATTDGSGNASIDFISAGPLTVGHVITATAYNDLTGDTSEFSACTAVTACGADTDCDGFTDTASTLHQGPANTNAALDNCPGYYNPAQANADGNFIDNSPPYAPALDDKTMIVSDAQGDGCDTDADNDGLIDAAELLGGCGSSTGQLNPLVRDTDGDRFLDGPECSLGTDPFSPASKPLLTACGAAGDADGDKVATRVEVCNYNTNPNSSDSDGDMALDGARDGCEMTSFNGDRVVNAVDQAMLAQGMGMLGYSVNIDINKDGALNSIDQALQAQLIVPPGQCP